MDLVNLIVIYGDILLPNGKEKIIPAEMEKMSI